MSPLLLALTACKSPTPTVAPETDADADTDSDTDADTDADTDTDSDTDTDVATDSFTDGTWTTTVTVDAEATLARTYHFSTDHPPRDSYPTQVTITELPDQPVLRSGSLFFDGLFAMAVQEARENATSEISDGAFANGSGQPCDCYQTGDLWTWVWTRDTAYAVDLGLAWLDPERARNSLQFKLSEGKQGEAAQIVQDTGTGGSWPVSTDRVVWALGAQAVLDVMEHGPDRWAFLEQAQGAVTTTADMDRSVAFDPEDGLYRGEQSFLDWREQTYGSFTANDVTPIAESKALGTNLGHWILLDAAARWSEDLGLPGSVYRTQADELAAAIQARFHDADGWHSVKGPPLDPSLSAQRDLLSEALAALHLPDDARDLAALSSYPNGPQGPPVIWPQQRDVPIYHNRGQWPFVTAYGMRAAARVRNADFYDRGAKALVDGAALNLTNLENAEWLTGEPFYDDGGLSGPVVNSRRQLWSVAGYLSFVVHDLFGVRPGPTLTFEPFVTDGVRDAWLDDTITLHRFPWRGETFNLQLQLPDGPGPYVGAGDFEGGDETTVTLNLTTTDAAGSLSEVDANDVSSWLAPAEPVLDDPTLGVGGVQLTWTGGAMDVLRDGEVLAQAATSPWTDTSTQGIADRSWCYALRATDGISSVNSAPKCWWGQDASRIQTVDAHHFFATDGTWSTANGRPHYESSTSTSVRFRPHHTGPHALQWTYANGAGARNTGITAAHKLFQLVQGESTVVAEGTFVMPHTAGWDQWRESTMIQAPLDADQTYTLTLWDAPNMADLAAMEIYTAGPGGGPDGYNFADITALKLLALDGPGSIPPANALAFDGTDDLGAFAAGQQLVPGATLQPWERFAMHWDDDFIYLALVSEAFEDPFKPFVLYLESDPGAATPGTGFEYSAQTAELSFTPTHAVAVRRQHDANDGLGPWSGVWTPGASDWDLQQRFVDGVDVWVAADQHTLAVRIPRYQLGDPSTLRLAGHVVNGVATEEWKDTVPATHTPWMAGGGDHLDVDLSDSPLAWAE